MVGRCIGLADRIPFLTNRPPGQCNVLHQIINHLVAFTTVACFIPSFKRAALPQAAALISGPDSPAEGGRIRTLNHSETFRKSFGSISTRFTFHRTRAPIRPFRARLSGQTRASKFNVSRNIVDRVARSVLPLEQLRWRGQWEFEFRPPTTDNPQQTHSLLYSKKFAFCFISPSRSTGYKI